MRDRGGRDDENERGVVLLGGAHTAQTLEHGKRLLG